MLGIYNHGGGGFVSTLKQAAKSLLIEANIIFSEKKLCDTDELKKYSIVVCHLSKDEVWRKILNNSPENTVWVRVSSVGFSKAKGKPSPQRRDNKVYELHLMLPAKELKQEQWQKILTGISEGENLEALVAGSNPQDLRYFFAHEEEWLAALSILCQGHLAVHAQSSESKEIAAALEQMGWTQEFFEGQGKSLGLSNLDSKIDEVRATSWWFNVLGCGEKLQDSLREEWQAVGDSPFPEALEQLLETMVTESQIQSPRIVAEAYLAIVHKLEEKKSG